MNTKPSLAALREHRMTGGNFYLRVSDQHVVMLNALPEFRDLTTQQLIRLLPKKYRSIIPPVGEFHEIKEHAHAEEDRRARAAIIGMLAPEGLVQHNITLAFMQRTVVDSK